MTNSRSECKSPSRWSVSDDETPRKAIKGQTRIRRNRLGYLPELLALETEAGCSRLLRNEPHGLASSKAHIGFRAIEFELNSNSKMLDLQSTFHVKSNTSKPPIKTNKHHDDNQPKQDSVIADLVALIANIECRRQRDFAAEEKRRQEEQARRHASEKLAEEKKEREAAERAQAEERKKLVKLSIPNDVKIALVSARAISRIAESSEYNRFLKDPHAKIKSARVAVGKAAGAVPNKLGNTMERLTRVYEGLEKDRQQITSSAADAVFTEGGFDVGPFQSLIRQTCELSPENLQALRDISLMAFHFYFRLSNVLLDNAQQQMSRNKSTMWTYAHFLALLWRQWGDDFKLVFTSVLHRRSNWAIPWPSHDLQIRKEATNDRLAEWCHETAGYLSLKLAMHVCLQDSSKCWQLLARLLNRLSEKYLTHPAVPFLVAGSLNAVNHFLCSKYTPQMIAIHQLLRQTLAPKLLEISRLPESWKEVRVPTTHLHMLLTDMDPTNPITRPPDGYVLSAKEEELNADV